jgi:type IV secretory pathway TrbF-like protein
MNAVANKRWKPEGDVETRYRRARQEWDRRMGTALAQAYNWRLTALLALGLVFISLLGTVYLGAQPKAVPHIVQIDRIGAPTYIGPVGQSAREWRPTDAALKYHLRRFITDTRTVSSDVVVMKRYWVDAYTLITASAGNHLNAFAQETNPIKRGEEERETADVSAVVQLSAESWQVDWVEKTWDKAGEETGSAVWRGVFRVLVRVPETEEQMAANPIGLFIDEFHWSKVQG